MATWFANMFGSNAAANSTNVGAAGPPTNAPVGQLYTNVNTGTVSVNTGSNWVNIQTGYGGGGGGSGVTGAVGNPGYVLSNTGWANVTTITSPLVVTTPDGKRYDITKILDAIMDQLCIIMPDAAKMEKYPALQEAYNEYKRLLVPEAAKEAYDNYKTIEALLKNSEFQDE